MKNKILILVCMICLYTDPTHAENSSYHNQSTTGDKSPVIDADGDVTINYRDKDKIIEKPNINVSGKWVADFVSSSGNPVHWVFTFESYDDKLFGTAPTDYVYSPEIHNGQIKGNYIFFKQVWRNRGSTDPSQIRDVWLTYRGKISGSSIDFIMQDDDGHSPFKFTVIRVTNDNTTIPAKGDTQADHTTDIQFVTVNPGCFQMGSNDKLSNNDEKPVHQVCLTQGYYLGKYEVTQGQWQKVMGYNPSRNRGNNKPVETVSWNDVQSFISKLNQQTGQHYRLPTEAEWEYACRSGGKLQKYCGSNEVSSIAWYGDNSGGTAQIVGQKKPNELGLYDMTGNVWEWLQDWDQEDYYINSPDENPKGSTNGTYRAIRGGGSKDGNHALRSTNRMALSPDAKVSTLGFRLARTP